MPLPRSWTADAGQKTAESFTPDGKPCQGGIWIRFVSGKRAVPSFLFFGFIFLSVFGNLIFRFFTNAEQFFYYLNIRNSFVRRCSMAGRGPGGPMGGRYMTEEEKANQPKITPELLKRVFSYLVPYWKQLLLVIAAIFVINSNLFIILLLTWVEQLR